ncbi:MAG TPA: helix-turn-helix transcriptional regulator [Candidatus Acidoferrales bacterium]|nr:helix-turn-helix transcriptional regulator [Candidatus Acidoferrales bacterium]
MTKQNPEDFLPLKSQWFHILAALASGEQHGYGIMQDVLDRTSGKVHLWPATLYGSMKRLMEADLIEESPRRPAPELDDARRRYYRLTPLGRRVLDAECDRLQGLVRGVRVKRATV